MKISEQEISRLLAYTPTDRVDRSSGVAVVDSPAARTSPAAQVEISTSAQDIQRIKDVIAQLPDVREDRVQALKAQVESGTYHVSSEDIADLMIRRALADNTAS
ncbi:MAG TPA: flagellar biosynthesis anti-sigma factor FlgM [Chthonomonadaceae bacterium]|nr:flagellar biosynthesis anti-sigma factor FlgM [Chthonomonadaceae bacterium]